MLIIAPCFHQRCKQKELNLDRQKSGIASEALIDSTVSVTARQSDTVPIASEVTIALVNRADATGAGRLSKPAVRGDRIIMGPDPFNGGRISRDAREFHLRRRQQCGEPTRK
jgi:hypothetical protein